MTVLGRNKVKMIESLEDHIHSLEKKFTNDKNSNNNNNIHNNINNNINKNEKKQLPPTAATIS